MPATATGKLADTPLAHALIYARNRRLSGRLELSARNQQSATIALWRGRIRAVETRPLSLVPGGYFGIIAYELGFIDVDTLESSLGEIARSKRLHGEVLIERQKIDHVQRDQALVEQIHRKVHFLFGLDDETTTYEFWDAQSPVEPPISTDLIGPVWRGIRDYPPARFVAETIRRIGDHTLRISPTAAENPSRPRLPPQEAALVSALAKRPMTIAEMKASTELSGTHVDLLAYLLVIAKIIEAASGVRTYPSTGALPAASPSGPMPRTISGHISSTRIPVYQPPDPKRIATPAAVTTTSSLGTVRTPAELGVDGIKARADKIESEDYFQVLGLNEGASAEAVRAAYMRLVKTWHPDKLVADFAIARGDVAKVFTHMTNAQKTLIDPDLRRAYLASRGPAKRTSSKTDLRTRSMMKKEVDAALATKAFDLAVKLTQEMITLGADDAEAMALQAWAEIRGGEAASDDELRATLLKMDRAIAVDATNASAHYYRGQVQKRLNNVLAAFRDFARAIQLEPSHKDAEREVRIFAMRAKKGSGEHKLALELLDKLDHIK